MAKNKHIAISAAQPTIVNTAAVAMQDNNLGLMKSLDICIPVCVYSYNRRKHTVVVLPLVKQMYYRHKWRAMHRLPFEVTIRSIQCGGFCIDYPVYIGDTGWVFSSDRSTSFLKDDDAPTTLVLGADRKISIVEDKLPQRPRQPLIHTLAEGFFLPDSWSKWEYARFKDANGVRLSDSLYIGTSFYDSDEEQEGNTSTSDDEGDKRNGGDGSDDESLDKEESSSEDSSDASDSSDADDGTYEGNPSASIVMTRNGIIHIMASSKERAKRHAHLKIKKDGIKLKLIDDNETSKKIWKKAVMSLRLDKGIEIDCKGEHQSNSLTLNEDGLEMKFKSDQSKDEKDAILTVSPKLDVNITTPGDVKVTAGNVTTECKNITTIGEETTFNLTSVLGLTTKVTLNASETVDIRALGDISLASSSKVFIGSAGDVAIGSVGSGGKVAIESNGGEIIIDSGGGDCSIKGGGDCAIVMKDGNVDIKCSGRATIAGEEFNISTSIGLLNDMQFINGSKLIIS